VWLLRNVVDRTFERRLAGLINSGERGVLRGGRKGVEKESLRVTPDGEIVQSPHPSALGAPLTNDNITTDFFRIADRAGDSPPFLESWELLQYLCDIHQFVYRHLGEELLWATSMPSAIESDASIPLAQFGTSNVGRMKTIYRHGLGMRYGRIMQAISGVHFNYSFPSKLWEVLAAHQSFGGAWAGFHFRAITSRCCGTIAGTDGWSCTSSAPHRRCPRSFFAGREIDLPSLDRDTVYEPFGTSLAHERYRIPQ